MTKKELAGALLSDYHHKGSMSITDVYLSLGESQDKVLAAYQDIIIPLQFDNGFYRRFDAIESVKVMRLSWP